MTAPTGHTVIAIDGPAASGKSSTAQWVAKILGFQHVDSGALYRAATAALLRRGGPGLERPELWTETDILSSAHTVSFLNDGTSFAPLIDGVPCGDEIRAADVTRNVSRVAQMPGVRAWVNGHVRRAAREHDLVVDGRDMGTIVFPQATLKIFLVADPWERARRRLIQVHGRHPSEAEIAEETDRLVQRDARDATQTTQATDAVLIDTTFLTQEEQVDRIVALAKAVTHRPSGTLVDGDRQSG
ncbi:MAG TPA: (d)CMP kinase [Gemmatimonadaceae bacterium]|nr:(d)CMP kinase [Gemmatimonadaceae bacterium]